MKIAMIGAGYVGLVSGVCFADFGHSVTCVDVNPDRIAALTASKVPIFEPGLEDLIAKNQHDGRLDFTTDIATAVAAAEVIFIAVGTPSRHGDGYADLTYVYAAAKELAAHISPDAVVVIKSTVPVGTGDEVERLLSENGKSTVHVVSNPEFLREGAAIEDFKHPDRIVIGLHDDAARQVMTELYRPLFLNEGPLFFTDRRSAELIKYSANAFLALKISFINEISDLCEQVHANVQDVARGIGSDERIGSKFLNAGPGYGGSCFPKDTLALLKIGQDAGAPLRLVEATVQVNDLRKRAMAKKVVQACGGAVRGKRIGVLGLTFKPNTDDMRDAPSIVICRALVDAGAVVSAYDPKGLEEAATVLPREVELCDTVIAAATGADCLVLVTEWDELRSLDLEDLSAVMVSPVLVDLRNVYRRRDVEARGFTYFDVGRALR